MAKNEGKFSLVETESKETKQLMHKELNLSLITYSCIMITSTSTQTNQL